MRLAHLLDSLFGYQISNLLIAASPAFAQIKPTKLNLSLIGRFPARPGTGEVYREFRTNRRPLNVASVVSRTVEQETSPVPGLAGNRWDAQVQMGL